MDVTKMKHLLAPLSVYNAAFLQGKIYFPILNFLCEYISGAIVFQATECIEQVLCLKEFVILLLQHSIVALGADFKVRGQQFDAEQVRSICIAGSSLVTVYYDFLQVRSVPRLELVSYYAKPADWRLIYADESYFCYAVSEGIAQFTIDNYEVQLYRGVHDPLCCFSLTKDTLCVVLSHEFIVLSAGRQIARYTLLGSAVAAVHDGCNVHVAFDDGRIQMLQNSGAVVYETARYSSLLRENRVSVYQPINALKAGDGFLMVIYPAFYYVVKENYIVACDSFSNDLDANLAHESVFIRDGQLFSQLGEYTCVGERKIANFQRNGIILRNFTFKKAIIRMKILRVRGRVVLVVVCNSLVHVLFPESADASREIEYDQSSEIQQIDVFLANMLVFRTRSEIVFVDAEQWKISKTDPETSAALLCHPRYLISFDRAYYASYYFVAADGVYCSPKKLFMPFVDVCIDETGLFIAALLRDRVVVARTLDLSVVYEIMALGSEYIRFFGSHIAVFGKYGGTMHLCNEETRTCIAGFEMQAHSGGKTREYLWASTSLLKWC